MSQEPALEPITPLQERKLAITIFNATWDLIDQETRSQEEIDAMICSAHASLYHWGQVGDAGNLSIGHWQVAHVYTILRHGDEALYHAQRCFDITTAAGLGDWRLAFAYEALARASASAGDIARCRAFREQAARAGAEITEPGERAHFETELARGPWFEAA